MNPLFASLMDKAAHLTRHGRLAEATEAIQRALRSEAQPRPAAPDGSNLPKADSDVIEVETRVVDVERQKQPPRATEGTEQWIRAAFEHQGRTIDYMLFVPASAVDQREAPPPLVVM